MQLDELNLNLLVDLEVLLRHRSVTAAAARQGVTQSAMSHSLRRLREMLGDELLVRGRSGTELTPRAERLAAQLSVQLDSMRRLLSDEDTFDAATAERTFRVAVTDYSAAVLGTALWKRLSAAAPRSTLEFVPLEPSRAAELLEEGEADLLLSPLVPDRPGLRRRKLFEGDHACLVRSGHPCLRRKWTLDAYCSLEHVLVVPRAARAAWFVDGVLAELGRRRRIALRLPWFSVAPLLASQTELAVTLPRVIGELFAPLGVRLLEVPVELPSWPMFAAWSERVEREPAHRLLRQAVVDVAAR